MNSVSTATNSTPSCRRQKRLSESVSVITVIVHAIHPKARGRNQRGGCYVPNLPASALALTSAAVPCRVPVPLNPSPDLDRNAPLPDPHLRSAAPFRRGSDGPA